MRRFLKLFKCKEHIYKTNTLGKSVACFRKSIAPKVGLYAINANYIAPRKAKKMDIKKTQIFLPIETSTCSPKGHLTLCMKCVCLPK